jgi:hypothetical protein
MSMRLALALLAAVACNGQDLPAKADEYLQARAKVNHFMGSVLVARDGKVLFAKSYGMANMEHDVPNTPQTKFRLGSITKQFAAAATLQLEERGKLSTDDPVCQYVADWSGRVEANYHLRLVDAHFGIWNFTPVNVIVEAIGSCLEVHPAERASFRRFTVPPSSFKDVGSPGFDAFGRDSC